MSLDETICAYFVNNLKAGKSIANDSTASGSIELLDQFNVALELMRQQLAETQIREIKPSEGYPLIASGNLTKKDVFVLVQFEGEFFDQLSMTKALILGPPCLVGCLRRDEPIPIGSNVIYTTAMRDLQISATGISPAEKEELSKLIQYMGGVYFQSFGSRITHLISNTIKSNKYEQATLNGIPVMHIDWVKCVWDRSRRKGKEFLQASDDEFASYRLPTFFGANITCSGLDSTRKDKVMRLVNDNGGIYHRAFRSQVVDIVITDQSKTDTDKYKAAVRFKKDVLLPEWVYDSAARGYALPTKKYEVRAGKKMSTPTKQSRATAAAGDQTQLSDISRISFVSGPSTRRMCSDVTTVNETLSSLPSNSYSSPAKVDLLKKAINANKNYISVLGEICPRQAKQAGTFLDGCCVYLSGFRMEEREKLNRVLNTGGATRFDEINDGISHIIVGQLDESEMQQWQRNNVTGHVVQLDWLLDSIKAGRMVDEINYRVSWPPPDEAAAAAADIASPASKRTLRTMNHSFKQPAPAVPIKKKLFSVDPPSREQEQQEEEAAVGVLLDQYSMDHEPAVPLPAASSTQLPVKLPPLAAAASAASVSGLPLPELSASTLSIDFDKLDYFSGISVYVHKDSFNAEFYNQILSECESAQGILVSDSFTDTVDYAIVSFEVAFHPESLPIQARHVVTELFVESCMKQNKLVPIEYYHLPVPAKVEREHLEGMTIVVSLYAGLERDYINSIAELMGAKVNKTFIKKEQPLLVCPTAEGSKYEGAIKWKFPVVTSAWLVECAKLGEKVPYTKYLVGKSPEDFPESPKLKERNNQGEQSTRSDGSKTNLNEQTMEEEAENHPIMAPPPVELTPLRNPRVSELAGHIPRPLSANSVTPPSSSSPRTPIGQSQTQSGYNFSFLEQFIERLDTSEEKDCVRQIIQEMRSNQTPELERIRRQVCTPVSRPRPSTGIPDFCLTPEFQQRMADDFERRWRLPVKKIQPDTPLSVIRQRVLRITCETLGIPYDNHEEQSPEVKPKQSPQTRARGKMTNRLNFDSPTLRSRSSSSGNSSRNQQQFVPATQSPNGSTINFDKISFEETAAPIPAPVSVSVSAAGKPMDTSNSPEVKQITDYLRRNSLKRSHGSHLASQESESAHFVQPFESEGFALNSEDNMVEWRDPAEFNANKQRRSSMSSSSTIAPTLHRFSISCGADDDQRNQLMDRIRNLGGEICENLVNYDPTCTHLICERPNRGEKMLGCLAAGKWILHIQYIDHCHAAGKFLDENLFEWGNPNAHNLPQLAPEEQNIAVAIHRSRSSGGNAFKNYRIILSLASQQMGALMNVVRAGGATVLQPNSPFADDPVAGTATHCFVDVKKAPLDIRDYQYLHDRNIPIMNQWAINAYLMTGKETSFEKYLLK
ncbi:DNA topoisomerase 2-binding protein 1 [Drosophila tropicalis]|uniref:DNA topoisomerase 2-binding protein 1 n=1 Tax=Drosophila tropicalis TaxID=46794 RepID=UPI0035AC1C0E